jgi:hypothetical protein
MDFAELAFDKINGLNLKNDSFYDPSNIHISDKFDIEPVLKNSSASKSVVFLFSISTSPEELFASNLVRKELYALENMKSKFLFFDLGNLNIEKEKIQPALDYIFSEIQENYNFDYKFLILSPSRKIIPGIISGIPENKITVSDINAKYDLSEAIENFYLEGKISFYNLISNLQFYYNKEVTPEPHFTNIMRLGEIKAENYIPYIEPLFRDSKLAIFSADAVSAAFAPASSLKSINGLSAYVFSTLSFVTSLCGNIRYNIYTSFADYHSDSLNLTGKLFAQSLWLYLNNFTSAIQESPIDNEEDFEKLIHFYTDLNIELTFYRSKHTKRYWFKIPQRNAAVAVSEKEYTEITKGKAPDRILKILKNL